jgi:RimJ/RimL family protein N-acetyltransferase
MENEIIFRVLTSDDVKEYKKIRLSCLSKFPDNFGTTAREEVESYPNKFINAVNFPCSDGFFYGAFRSNDLVGICGFIKEGREKTAHRGEIAQVFLEPEYWGKGIGEKLLRLTVSKAFEYPEVDQLILSAVKTNAKAALLYEKIGFKTYGVLENYFKHKDHSSSQIFMYLKREDRLVTTSPKAEI